MDYFAGLDISMDETHICVLDREGVIVYEGKTASSAEAIAGELAVFQHRVMGGSSSTEADRIGNDSEEETRHGLFCWPRYLNG